MKRYRLAFGALALVLALSVSACTGDSAQSDTQSAAQSDPSVPVVDRSGQGSFPEATGAFGEDPKISAGSGEAPDKVLVKTLVKGEGAEIDVSDTVVVNYELALWDGTMIESSFERGKPNVFALDKVIPGWTHGLAKQHVGDRVEIVIPPKWGYGDKDNSSIPGGSTLVFVVDVINSSSNVKIDEDALATARPTGNPLPDGIEVSGDPGKEPTVSFAEGATAPADRTQVELLEGRGAVIEEGDSVLIREVDVIFGDTSKSVSSWSDKPLVVEAGALDLAGKAVGTRNLYVVSTGGPQAQSEQAAMMVAIIDVVGVMKTDGSSN